VCPDNWDARHRAENSAPPNSQLKSWVESQQIKRVDRFALPKEFVDGVYIAAIGNSGPFYLGEGHGPKVLVPKANRKSLCCKGLRLLLPPRSARYPRAPPSLKSL